MTKVLVRAHQGPFEAHDPETTLRRNLVGDNVGNLVFSHAVHRILSASDVELSTARLNWASRLSPSRINAGYDALVLPLANAFRPRFLPNLDRLSEIIEGIKIPVTVLGVGVQAPIGGLSKDAEKIASSVRRFVSAALDKSPSIGVRGEFTRDYLVGLGFDAADIEVIGCPSMFLNGADLTVDRRVPTLDESSPIALNVSQYVNQMAAVTARHAQAYPNLRYIAQDIHTLELLLWGEYSGRGKSTDLPIHLEHQLIQENRVRFCLDPTTWINHLKEYDFSFGTRIHGNIVALLAGTPAVVLAHDSRTLELARYHEVPHHRIRDVAATVDAAELYETSDWKPMVDGHARRFDVFSRFLHAHGLRHVFEPGESPQRFDDAIAAVDFPPPVGAISGLSIKDLYELKRQSRVPEDPAEEGSWWTRARRSLWRARRR